MKLMSAVFRSPKSITASKSCVYSDIWNITTARHHYLVEKLSKRHYILIMGMRVNKMCAGVSTDPGLKSFVMPSKTPVIEVNVDLCQFDYAHGDAMLEWVFDDQLQIRLIWTNSWKTRTAIDLCFLHDIVHTVFVPVINPKTLTLALGMA